MHTLDERNQAYLARRIVRAVPNGATHRKLMKMATPRVLAMIEILPALLTGNCVAQAEALAIEATR